MKKIAFILLLISCSLSWAQNFTVSEKPTGEPIKAPFSEEEYSKLLNYTPKLFVANTKSKPENRVLMGDLNSISALELRYAYQEQLKLNPSEIEWMEGEINSLATAYFNGKKPILIERTGVYGDCAGREIKTEQRNGYKVTIIKFCYTFPGAEQFEDRFLEIFNKKTEELIAVKKVVKKPVAKKSYTKKRK